MRVRKGKPPPGPRGAMLAFYTCTRRNVVILHVHVMYERMRMGALRHKRLTTCAGCA